MTTAAIQSWINSAREAVDDGTFDASYLDRLQGVVDGSSLCQKLLYLHATSPSIQSKVIAYAIHDVQGTENTGGIDPLAPPSPYKTVHEAILDGWRVIHFPLQTAPFEDREIDILGYEFILEKLTVRHG